MSRKNKGVTEVEGKTYWVNVKVDCPWCFERAEESFSTDHLGEDLENAVLPCRCVRLIEIKETDETKDPTAAVL